MTQPQPLDADSFSRQELFQKDLRTQLMYVLSVLEPQPGSFSAYAMTLCETLCRFTQAMGGPAMLMDYTAFVVLLDVLGLVSRGWMQPKLLEQPSDRFTQFHRIVSELVAVCKKMVEVAPSSLPHVMKANLGVIENCLHALQAPDVEAPLKAAPALSKAHEEKGQESSHQEVLSSNLKAVSQMDPTILTLFFVDLETYTRLLQEGLLVLELDPSDQQTIASLMRAAHSIKGAARVIGLDDIVHLAHALEECFLHVQSKDVCVEPHVMERLFCALDLFQELIKQPSEAMNAWLEQQHATITELTQNLMHLIPEGAGLAGQPTTSIGLQPNPPPSLASELRLRDATESRAIYKGTLRITAAYLNRLMGLAGEFLVESRRLQPFSEQLLQVKNMLHEQSALIDALRACCDERALGEEGSKLLLNLQRQTRECRLQFSDRLDELEECISKVGLLSDGLYREVVSSRLCPFNEGVKDLPRMVRDLSQYLHKQVKLEIIGRSVTVDRDILDKLQTPLQHLLRNAIDHGIESPAQRIALGKPAIGTIRLEAYHRAGLLNILVEDDGCGIDLMAIKQVVIKKQWMDVNAVEKLNKEELLSFLFSPGFTTNTQATELSGRGFGLNTVQTMVHEVCGKILVDAIKGKGTRFCLQLPLALSILRALLVNIAGEAYAFPLARSACTVVVDLKEIQQIDHSYSVQVNGQNIVLIWGFQLLGMPFTPLTQESLSIVVLTQQAQHYGIIVDALIGEKELILQELDPHLGKIQSIICGALMEDGSPVLVIDVDEIIAAAEGLLASHESVFADLEVRIKKPPSLKRILVVEDSITVREVESRILEAAGYSVDVAANGVDAWNLVRIKQYDLIITAVDMPYMDGVEFVRLIKRSDDFRHLPIMIVSYREHPEERALGIEAGADAYIAKSQFRDDAFLAKVHELLTEKSAC